MNFHFENTFDPMDIKALDEAQGVRLDKLKKLKDNDDIDDMTYQKAAAQFKTEQEMHSA